MNIRKFLYKYIDSLKKESVINKLSLLKSLISDEKLYITYKEDLVKSFLETACNTPFYRQYKGKDLKEFPVITKADIKSNLNSFYNSLYKKNELIKVHTSGSYGTPFEFLITKEKKAHQLAEIIYSGSLVKYDIGTKHVYSRSVNSKSVLKLYAQNEIFIPCKEINEKFLKSSRDTLKQKNVKVWIGFSSVIARIADYCIKHGDKPEDFRLKEGGVITSSEELTSHHRDLITQAFGCKACSRYSTEETGVLGHQIEKNGPFILNRYNYVIELLKMNSNEPAEPGEVGRIVVTDLYSNAMPLIRYEIGDLAVIEDGKNDELGYLTELKHLSGRKVEVILSTNGETLYPLNIDNIVESHLDVVQYQFIQESQKDYRLLIVTQEYDKIDTSKIKQELLGWVGNDAKIEIEHVDQIPTLPSGKRPYVVNKYKRNV